MEEETLSDPQLIKNLMSSFGDVFYSHMSDQTREFIFKEGLRIELHNLVKKLNSTYSDVHFNFRWQIGVPASHFKYDQLFVGGFDRDVADDSSGWVDDIDDQESMEKLYASDLNQLGIIVFFHWHRTCDLGCRHRTTRFYYYSMPKVTELISYHLLDPADMKEYVKRYVPNFFY